MVVTASSSQSSGYLWLVFALMTVVSWGTYGVFIHKGQVLMGDPVHGRYKAFLFIGLAYVLVAIVGPILMLWLNGANWTFTPSGIGWSLVAGIVGALGAFCVLLALGAKGPVVAVMSVIFAGAPIVNAITAYVVHPPAGGLGAIRPQFVLGILLAALGGYLVVTYKDPKPLAPQSVDNATELSVASTTSSALAKQEEK